MSKDTGMKMLKIASLPFDSDLHEDLFKLMILVSNDWEVWAIENYWWEISGFWFED